MVWICPFSDYEVYFYQLRMSDRAYTNEWLINKKKFSLLCGVYYLLQNLKWLWGLADESHFIE